MCSAQGRQGQRGVFLLKRAKIICVGNGFLEEDSIGRRVYEVLKDMELPEGVGVFDAGLSGLDSVLLLKDTDRAVFADAVSGFCEDGGIAVLKKEEVASLAVSYGHSAGIPYLFNMADAVLDGKTPEMILVGSENGTTDVYDMAVKCLEVALHGTGL